MKTIAIIQARMASSRLPGKVLLEISGKAMLQWVVERAGMAETADQVIVATTTDPSDDPIAAFCEKNGILHTRGSQHDVLDRYIQTARQFNATIIVRLTADCPLLDPGLIDETVHLMQGSGLGTWSADFTANRLPPPWGRSYPIGLDVEVVTMEALERAWSETSEKHHREHVMPYFYDDLPPEPLDPGKIYTTSRGFKVAQLHHVPDHGNVRWTVDTPEDYETVGRLADLLSEPFTWLDAISIWQQHPEIAEINSRVVHKTASDIDERA